VKLKSRLETVQDSLCGCVN